MNRDTSVQRLDDRNNRWDVVVIGGGATGLGAAVEAASRGYRTGLLEQHDFAKGTSNRSTKLVYGGVGYFRQGGESLALETFGGPGPPMWDAPHPVRDPPV